MEQIVKSRDGNFVDRNLPRAEEAFESAKEKGSDVWNSAKAKGRSLWSETGSANRKVLGQVKGFIQKHPGQAVGYAVLLGAILTVLLYPKGRE